MNFQILAKCALDAYADSTICDKQSDTQVLIRRFGDEVVVAFRGTNDWQKVIGDLEVELVRFGPYGLEQGKWHRGVRNAVESVFYDLLGILGQDKGPIYFTGHSFGGGCAPAMAYLLSSRIPNIRGVVTFAGMRFGDRCFAQNYSIRMNFPTWRICAEFDPVPHLPEPALFLPYKHVGKEILVSTADDGLTCEQISINPGWWQSLKRDLSVRFFSKDLAAIKEDLLLPLDAGSMHSMKRYRCLVSSPAFPEIVGDSIFL